MTYLEEHLHDVVVDSRHLRPIITDPYGAAKWISSLLTGRTAPWAGVSAIPAVLGNGSLLTWFRDTKGGWHD